VAAEEAGPRIVTSPVVTCVVDIVTLGSVLFLSLQYSPVSYHRTNAPYSTIIRNWYNSRI
jgi:hypothetical protein